MFFERTFGTIPVAMASEKIDIDQIVTERRQAVAASIRPIDSKEAAALCDTIFPSLEHPWREKFVEFLSENPGEALYHAALPQGGQIIYSRTREKGIWFVPGTGVGLIQPKALKALSEILSGGV